MYTVNRHGSQWQAVGPDGMALGATPLEALRSLKKHEGNVLERTRRWVVYAASEDRALSSFGNAVTSAGGEWKPVAVDPLRLEEAVEVLQPELVVIAAARPQDSAVVRRAHAQYGRQRLVVDDRHLPVVSKLLVSARITG